MSNKGAIIIKIGEAFVELITDGRKLTAGLNDAEKQVVASTNAMSQKFKAIGTVMTAVGGVITAAFALIIKKTVDVGDAFNDMSLRTGVAVEELSALAYAGKQTGTDIEAIELSLKFLTRAMDDTSKGIGTAKDTFAALGISVTDAEGKLRPTVEVMKDVATAVAAIDDPARQAAVAMELFGARSGTQLVPLLKLGEKGIDDLMKKAEELGIVLSTKEAQAADEFKDKMNDLKDVLGAAGRDIANVLIPSLTALSIKAVEIIKKIREWADEHKTLIEWIVKLGAGLGVLAAVGGPILLAVSAFTKMQGAITALGTISSGPIGIAIIAIAGIAVGSKLLYDRLEETVGGMREFREELKNMSLFQLNLEIQKLTDSAEQLQKRFSEIPKGIGQQEILTMIDGINKRLKLLYERKDEIDNLSTSISGFGEQLEITGGKIETFDEMVARMAEETKAANEAIAKSTKDLANIMQPTYDKLYEMSHTAEEIAVRALNAQKDAQVEAVKALNLSVEAQAAALAKIAELYNIEVGLIISKLEEERDKQIEVAIVTEKSWEAVGVATRKIRGEYDPLIEKLKELAIVTESSAARQVSALKTVITAQGVLLTNINNIQSAGSYAEAQAIVAVNQAKPTTIPATTTKPTTTKPTTATPATIPSGATVTPSIPIPYVSNQVTTNAAGNVTSITLPGGGTISIGTKSYQLGTPYVPKTGLYQLHQGESVIPKNQNTTNNKNSYSPIINVTVQGDGDIKKIKQVITQVLQDSARQFRRSGFELVPGRG